MRKAAVLLLFFVAFMQQSVIAQQEVKRKLTTTEVKQLSHYSDSILNQIKKIHRNEIREQAPGKYQPQRIALVRDYLWLFEFLEYQYQTVDISIKNVISIIGEADKTHIEEEFTVKEYTAQNNPHIKLKNFKYSLVFKKNYLVMVKRY